MKLKLRNFEEGGWGGGGGGGAPFCHYPGSSYNKVAESMYPPPTGLSGLFDTYAKHYLNVANLTL